MNEKYILGFTKFAQRRYFASSGIAEISGFFTYIDDASGVLSDRQHGGRLFCAILDLQIAASLLDATSIKTLGMSFGETKLENDSDVCNLLEQLEVFGNLALRSRAYLDKFFGFCTLLLSPDLYDDFTSARSRKSEIRKTSKSWTSFPDTLLDGIRGVNFVPPDMQERFLSGHQSAEDAIDYLSEIAEYIDKNFRTGEAHHVSALSKLMWKSQNFEPLESGSPSSLVSLTKSLPLALQSGVRKLCEGELTTILDSSGSYPSVD